MIKLNDLAKDVIMLCVHFPGGHVHVSGRVRIVGTRIWVGQCCLSRDTMVSKGVESGEYLASMRGDA